MYSLGAWAIRLQSYLQHKYNYLFYLGEEALEMPLRTPALLSAFSKGPAVTHSISPETVQKLLQGNSEILPLPWVWFAAETRINIKQLAGFPGDSPPLSQTSYPLHFSTEIMGRASQGGGRIGVEWFFLPCSFCSFLLCCVWAVSELHPCSLAGWKHSLHLTLLVDFTGSCKPWLTLDVFTVFVCFFL